MRGLNPYLNFDGTTEEAFTFYKSIFGGEFTYFQRVKDTPDGDKLPPDEQNRIMHVSLPIGNATLMASDTMPSMGAVLQPGNNCNVMAEAETKDEADRVFAALSEGGTVDMPIADMFWGDYFGSLTDRFGINWMVIVSGS